MTPRSFRLRASFQAPAVFAAAKVAGTPLAAEGQHERQGPGAWRPSSWTAASWSRRPLHGEGGTAVELERRSSPWREQADEQTHVLEIVVENRGFVPARTGYWPERRRGAPADEGSWFALNAAELGFPAAAAALAELRQWQQAFQFADILLNPELKRYTFTGKPYDIPDKRLVAKEKLARLNAAFDRAVAALDLNGAGRGRLAAGAGLAEALAAPGRRRSRPTCGNSAINLVGNAHIDIAWLWRMAETMALSKNTYETVITNMAEYPELTYAQSQAVTYDWMEKKHPDLFQAIKEKVRSGRWEIVGGMWVEPDCNLIAGESWARQLLYGKKYFREKFGVDVRIGWNPDSFGYNWNMPQLYKLGGIDSFITQKLWWNDTTVFPHFLFNWQGVDGSTILTYMPPLSYASSAAAEGGGQRHLQVRGHHRPQGEPHPLRPGRPRRRPQPRDPGPRARLRQAGAGAEVHPHHPQPLPAEDSAGRSWTCRCGRTSSTWSTTRGPSPPRGPSRRTTAAPRPCWPRPRSSPPSPGCWATPIPSDELEKSWKSALTLQFHDILPGSCITPVYRDALETFQGRAAGTDSGWRTRHCNTHPTAASPTADMPRLAAARLQSPLLGAR